MGGPGQHPPRGSSCSPTPPTAPESTQSPVLAPSRPCFLGHFVIDPPFPRPILGLERAGGSKVGVRRVDKGQFYFSVVVAAASGWEKEEVMKQSYSLEGAVRVIARMHLRGTQGE